MRKDLRVSLLQQAWEFSFLHDKQIAIGVEKMYYKRYFKDEVDRYLDYLDAFEVLYRKKHGRDWVDSQ